MDFVFIHSVVCLTTGQLPLPKRFIQSVRSCARSFSLQYLVSVRSYSSCWHLNPSFPVATMLLSTVPLTTHLKCSSHARCNNPVSLLSLYCMLDIPLHLDVFRMIVKKLIISSNIINPLTPELNPSAQRCLTRFFTGILLLEPFISLIYAWKTNKCNNYSFSLLIMYGSFYMFWHYIAIFRERFYCTHHVTKHSTPIHNIVSTDPQLSISVCKCVMYCCHRVSTQLRLNICISYHIISRH
jgi:hypothetical protein